MCRDESPALRVASFASLATQRNLATGRGCELMDWDIAVRDSGGILSAFEVPFTDTPTTVAPEWGASRSYASSSRMRHEASCQMKERIQGTTDEVFTNGDQAARLMGARYRSAALAGKSPTQEPRLIQKKVIDGAAAEATHKFAYFQRCAQTADMHEKARLASIECEAQEDCAACASDISKELAAAAATVKQESEGAADAVAAGAKQGEGGARCVDARVPRQMLLNYFGPLSLVPSEGSIKVADVFGAPVYAASALLNALSDEVPVELPRLERATWASTPAVGAAAKSTRGAAPGAISMDAAKDAQRPLLIRNGARELALNSSSSWTRERLLKVAGERLVETYAMPYSSTTRDVEPKGFTIADYVQYLERRRDGNLSAKLHFAVVPVPEADDPLGWVSTEPPILEDRLRQQAPTQFYLGGVLMGSPPMHHQGHVFDSLVYGKKLWLLRPPAKPEFSREVMHGYLSEAKGLGAAKCVRPETSSSCQRVGLTARSASATASGPPTTSAASGWLTRAAHPSSSGE
ncbi:unnamed protein product [Prorocentrum cordatum]|uniref:JmjC domain-containing protein n=1 Tax=Prorocentrum cordatum TaxID=2364126 RepID=A0ABN9TKQ5_9DINO|nr:unnamed protein product [Polarella glacialis]